MKNVDIKKILEHPITMLIAIFILVNCFTYYNYSKNEIEKYYAKIIKDKHKQNIELKLKEVEKDNLVIEDLICNRFDDFKELNNIEVKNIENNIKKNRSLKYTIKNNTNKDVYITSEILKRTVNKRTEVPLIDFIGYKKLIKKGEEVQLEINPIETGYINSMHDVLTKAIYELSREDNLSIKPIGYINIKY